MIIKNEDGLTDAFRGCTIGRLKEFIRMFNWPDDYILGQNSVGNLLVIASEKDGHSSEAYIDAVDEKFVVFDNM